MLPLGCYAVLGIGQVDAIQLVRSLDKCQDVAMQLQAVAIQLLWSFE